MSRDVSEHRGRWLMWSSLVGSIIRMEVVPVHLRYLEMLRRCQPWDTLAVLCSGQKSWLGHREWKCGGGWKDSLQISVSNQEGAGRSKLSLGLRATGGGLGKSCQLLDVGNSHGFKQMKPLLKYVTPCTPGESELFYYSPHMSLCALILDTVMLSAAKAERPVQDDDGEEGHLKRIFSYMFHLFVEIQVYDLAIGKNMPKLCHHRQDVLCYASNLLELDLFWMLFRMLFLSKISSRHARDVRRGSAKPRCPVKLMTCSERSSCDEALWWYVNAVVKHFNETRQHCDDLFWASRKEKVLKSVFAQSWKALCDQKKWNPIATNVQQPDSF